MGSEVERVELGPAPAYEYWDEVGDITPEIMQLAMDALKGRAGGLA